MSDATERPRRSQSRRQESRASCWIRAAVVAFSLLFFAGAALALLRAEPPATILLSPENAGPPPAPPSAVPTAAPEPPDRRLIFTYYFYWYDALTGGHLDEAGGLRHHLPSSPPPNWRSVEWHRKELSDMAWAGIDVVLPVYWGDQDPRVEWSWKGLEALAQAQGALKREGREAPAIGLFLDTTIMDRRDLTTAEGKAFFYHNIRSFFHRVPRSAWALVNGRPVVFLYTTQWVAAFDQSTLDHVYERFAADFGVRPYIVREISWDYPILRWEGNIWIRDYERPIRTENNYLWEAAYHGYIDHGGVAVVGPGYDDRLIPDRGGGKYADRRNGAFYREHFEAAIRSGKPLLVIETWNEVHEGSGISETVEFGRQYLEITREMAARFQAAR